MLIVPVKGDKIETVDGHKHVFTVIEYTNYREKGPAVYVEHTPSVPSDAVYFFDIIKINEVPVKYKTSSKVFEAHGDIKRRFHLPQPKDTVTFKAKDGNKIVKVIDLKLHKHDELAKGLLVVGQEKDSDERHLIRLEQMMDLERNIGNDMFSRDKFLSYYADYRGQR